MQISGLPQRFDREKFESLLSKFGSFQISETREESNFVTATVQYGSKDDVERWALILIPILTRSSFRWQNIMFIVAQTILKSSQNDSTLIGHGDKSTLNEASDPEIKFTKQTSS